ncbi:helitron_like_N domain-containing protein [Trichonephila clavipes]|nr:helitron_like_N domain-containing protein [Trichonephila clavipes]
MSQMCSIRDISDDLEAHGSTSYPLRHCWESRAICGLTLPCCLHMPFDHKCRIESVSSTLLSPPSASRLRIVSLDTTGCLESGKCHRTNNSDTVGEEVAAVMIARSCQMPRKKSNLNNASTREARRKRIKRAHQLAEQIESRNLAQRISTAEGHAQESQEQCNERLQENIIRTRAAGERDIATSNATEKSNLNNASSKGSRRKRVERAQQLPEQIETRNAAQRIRTAESRARESQEQRDERLQQNITRTRVARERNIATVRALDRQRQRISRSLTRASFVRLAFEYAPDINYSAHSKIAIGGMDKVCQYCHALKFRNEAAGMCCASGKVVLSPLPAPPEPLLSLLTGNSDDSKLFLQDHNQLIQLIKRVSPRLQNDNYQIVIKADKVPLGEHAGRFNAPTVDEVAVIMVGDYRNNKVSSMNYYAHRIMVRQHQDNYILRYRQLFHQYIVDMYAKVESERLRFLRFNQAKLRSEEYIHLRDAVAGNIDGNLNPNDIGNAFILPSSYIGSPRNMQEYMQDAMTYVRHYGRPDLFITFTCNPNWEEIQTLLLPGQQAIHRHDLTARVFKQKLKSLIDFIVKYSIFGITRCWLYTIEWQKRGLPHAHILVWLKDRIRPEEIDQIISAEIPDPLIDQELFDIVTKHMIHGPCGAFNMTSPCMENGKCKKTSQSRIRMTRSRILMVIQSIAAEVLRMVATHLQCDCRTFQIKLSLIMSGWYHTHHYFQKLTKLISMLSFAVLLNQLSIFV